MAHLLTWDEVKELDADSWRFLGTDEPRSWCGTSWATKSAKSKGTSKHKICLDDPHAGQVAVMKHRNTCNRASCKICHPNWLAKTTAKIVDRLEHASKTYKKNGFRNSRSIHTSVSPPEKLQHLLKTDKY